MSDIHFMVSAVEDYERQVAGFTRHVEGLMDDLKRAVVRAGETWRDESMEVARERAEGASRRLLAACDRLGEELARVRRQIDWAVNDYNSIR